MLKKWKKRIKTYKKKREKKMGKKKNKILLDLDK